MFGTNLWKMNLDVSWTVSATECPREPKFPILKNDIPAGQKATYVKVVVDIRPNKAEIKLSRLVVGGDKVEYPFEVSTSTASLETVKKYSSTPFYQQKEKNS